MSAPWLTGVWLALAVTVAPGVKAQGAEPPPVAAQDSAQRRAELERAIRQRVGQIVRDSLGLTTQQFQQLRQTNRRYEEQRRPLLQEERSVRQELRQAIGVGGAQADQPRVSALMDRLYSLQHQRLDLNQKEQQDLSGFLNPVQRAQYAAVQERLRLRMEELRREQRGAGSGLRPPRTAVPRAPLVKAPARRAPAKRPNARRPR